MSSILLSNSHISAEYLQQKCNIKIANVIHTNGAQAKSIQPNTPYLLDANTSGLAKNVVNQISSIPKLKSLTELAVSLGSDQVIALAEMTQNLKDSGIAVGVGLMGASTSTYTGRTDAFTKAIKNYQHALLEYRKALKSNSRLTFASKQKAISAFNDMQKKFGNELKMLTSKVTSKKGTPLTSSERALNIAKSSRNIVKLNVSDVAQANNLVKFTSQAKLLGNGLAIIDFGSRIGNVKNSHSSGGDWEREMFIESSSFALSATAGIAAVNVGTAALGFIIVVTPVGWVGLIVGGAIVVGAAVGASMGVDYAVKNNAGSLYDDIMEWIL